MFSFIAGLELYRASWSKYNEQPLTSVYAESTVVFVQRFQSCDVWSAFDDFVHPLDPSHHFVAEQ